MCGRYILVQKLELIEKRFNVTAPGGVEWKPAYNISPGQVTPVITSDNPKELQLFHFALGSACSGSFNILSTSRLGNPNSSTTLP